MDERHCGVRVSQTWSADGALMLAATALSAFRDPAVVSDAEATFAGD